MRGVNPPLATPSLFSDMIDFDNSGRLGLKFSKNVDIEKRNGECNISGAIGALTPGLATPSPYTDIKGL